MKNYKMEELREGMVLKEAVFNSIHNVVLLGEGTVLTARHIELMKNLGIQEVRAQIDTLKPTDEAMSQVIDETEEKAKTLGIQFDAAEFKKALNLFHSAVDTAYNEKKELKIIEKVPVLTGEGGLPFDVKHEQMLDNVKGVFGELKNSSQFNYSELSAAVSESVEDMIINNDILMRLNQLKEDDDYTFQHALRVSMLATSLGKWMGYNRNEIEDLSIAGLMFDIGKMRIPDFLYNRKESLSEMEYEMYKKHPQLSYTILLQTQGVSQGVRFAALQHHERIDGSGYPLRLKGGQIHPYSKIIMVCDIFDAMITDRPYNESISPFDAATYLYHHSGITLDQEVTYVFLKKLAEYYMGKKLLLDNGEEAMVVFVDSDFPHQPIIKVKDKIINLHEHPEIKVVKFL